MSRKRHSFRLAFGLALGAGPLVTAASVRADNVLHEYIAPDPADDLRLGATTSDGTMPAAIETQSGAVASPDLSAGEPSAPGGRERRVYGGSDPNSSTARAYHVDSDTSRPDRVSYDDPFTPAITPYKREVAYDSVNDAFELVERDPTHLRITPGGAPQPSDDQFYGDFQVETPAGGVARVPTVGPGARLLGARSVPSTKLEFFRDAGDNWFVKTEGPGRVRLVVHLAIDRAVFGSPFATVEWPALYRLLPRIPDAVRREGIAAARQIGVVDGTGPAEALSFLVTYFRGFAPSENHPVATGAELYRELVLSKKGVCRHRAYAFVVTALALGLPSRFIRNEAHAWVEVTDGIRFHRIDLGGAAGDVDFAAESVAHVPPRDPYAWPAAEDSGQALAGRARAAQAASGSGQHAAPDSSASLTSSAPGSPDGTAEEREDPGERSTVTVSLGGKEATRGARLRVSGTVVSRSGPCGEVRVDLVLEQGGHRSDGSQAPINPRIVLGTLVTNDEGRYGGSIVVPFSIPPGDYDVRAITPGGSECGRGTSP